MFRRGDQLIGILGGTTGEFAQVADKNGEINKRKNPCGYKHFKPTTHSNDEFYSNPKNSNKSEVKLFLAKKRLKKRDFRHTTDDYNNLKAATSAQQSLIGVHDTKVEHAQHLKASLAEIMDYDDIDDNEIDARELVMSLSAHTVNVSATYYHCYKSASTSLNTTNPIMDSGASKSFTKNTTALIIAQKHQSTINIENRHACFTEAMGK